MNLRTRLRGRPRNRWKDEVREGGRMVGGEEWQEKVHNRKNSTHFKKCYYFVLEETPENGKESLHSAHTSGIGIFLHETVMN